MMCRALGGGRQLGQAICFVASGFGVEPHRLVTAVEENVEPQAKCVNVVIPGRSKFKFRVERNVISCHLVYIDRYEFVSGCVDTLMAHTINQRFL